MKLGITLATLGLVALTTTVTPAFAEKGGNKAHGNSHAAATHKASATTHGNSASAKAASGNGALHSELKGLNAVKANPNALAHAAPNSQVGRIAQYRDAALVTKDAAALRDDAAEILANLPVPTNTVEEIDAAILALDPVSATYAADLAALTAQRDQITAYTDAAAALDGLQTTVDTAQDAEDAALLLASGGRSLSDAAIAYIRSVLNL